MPNIELAKAYVTIVPSMDGAQQAITDGLTGASSTAGTSAGRTAGATFSRALGVAAAAGTAAVGAAATGITRLTQEAVSAYGDYEQLTGGIETLYGEASAQMMEYASQAATTTGQSINEFMESAISTSAAMINAVEGDQQRAAELTNLAMIDMADNANKLGTDMEMIQNAYRGFSRGNFTMLDNLALGYAGTKEGMQELLAAATELSGVEYDINSYADIVEAIHVVQTEMGITGTTASEASETIQGSLGSLTASWQNLITGIANPEADLSSLIRDVVTNAEITLSNLVPTISNALSGIGEVITGLAPVISQELPGLVSTLLPPLLLAAGSILNGLGTGLISALPTLAPVISKLIVELSTFIIQNLPLILQAGIDIVVALAESIGANAPTLIPMVVQCVNQIVSTLLNNIDDLLLAGMQLLIGVGLGIVAAIPDMIAFFPQVFEAIQDTIQEFADGLWESASTWGADMIDNFINGIMGGIGRLGDAVSNVASTVRSYIGFSEPERGPLSNFHTYAPDMLELFEEGLEEGTPELEASLNRTLTLPSLDSTSSMAFDTYEPAGDEGGNIVIPVSIGQERLDTIMVRSSQIATFRRGG